MEKETKSLLTKILTIIGIIAAVAGIAFAVYKFIIPKFIEKKDDEFDDDYYEITPDDDEDDEFAE